MGPDTNLRRLHEAGVSIWLDTLSRDLLQSGEFATLIRDFSVTGATSNPTIFAKAITGSDLYDGELRDQAAGGERDLQELFFSLALDDVREAARELRPTFDATGGRDGYISFECTPDLADDTEATIAQATDLWRRLDLPRSRSRRRASPTGAIWPSSPERAGIDRRHWAPAGSVRCGRAPGPRTRTTPTRSTWP